MNSQFHPADDKHKIIERACFAVADGDIDGAKKIIVDGYPFDPNPGRLYHEAVSDKTREKGVSAEQRAWRQYGDGDKLRVFFNDGFVDRYSGQPMIFTPVLFLLSRLMQKEFPYSPNWKRGECHLAYWDLLPTVDHITPIYQGGDDSPENWATTSQRNNNIKTYHSLEDIGEKLLPPGNPKEWDGLFGWFMDYSGKNETVLDDGRIAGWRQTALREIRDNPMLSPYRKHLSGARKNRLIFLDTETTGLSAKHGERIIEVAAVAFDDKKQTEVFQGYFNPQRDVHPGAYNAHGKSREDLAAEPLFAERARELAAFIDDAEVIMHNAPFDVGFLDEEFARAGVDASYTAVCSLQKARQLHPNLGRYSLDFLCREFGILEQNRELHGALLDAELLAKLWFHPRFSLADNSVADNSPADKKAETAAPADETAKWTDDMSVTVFHQNTPGFFNWQKNNPDGFVFHCWVLHASQCMYVYSKDTSTNVPKVCFPNKAELLAWVKSEEFAEWMSGYATKTDGIYLCRSGCKGDCRGALTPGEVEALQAIDI